MESFFSWIIISLVVLLPIFVWGYLFGYIDNNNFQKKRFWAGIFAGGLSVFPVLYLGDISTKLDIKSLNIFQSLVNFLENGNAMGLFLSFLVLLFLFSIIPFVLFYLTPISKEKLKTFLYRYVAFGGYFLVILGVFYVLNLVFQYIPYFQTSLDFGLEFEDIVFHSLYLVIFYYLMIGIIEEVAKFFFFSYSNTSSAISTGLVNAIFVALGFAFIENILYIQSLYDTFGWGGQVFSTYILRNIFSVFLHILCSSIFAYFFLKVTQNKSGSMQMVKYIFIGFVLAFVLHGLFDIFLSLGLFIFLLFYIIGGYFYFTYIFYKK